VNVKILLVELFNEIDVIPKVDAQRDFNLTPGLIDGHGMVSGFLQHFTDGLLR
jgi:hypothetical protein